MKKDLDKFQKTIMEHMLLIMHPMNIVLRFKKIMLHCLQQIKMIILLG